MRLLLLNPNTSPDITALLLRHARAFAASDTALIGTTGRFGARYIVTRAAAAIAAHAALDAYAEHIERTERAEHVDAVILACFGDPGLLGLRELAQQPVIGLAEAACQAAALNGKHFAIVTGGERWGPMLEEFVAALGLSAQLACVLTVASTGADIARDPDNALALLADTCNEAARLHGAQVVILGGAGLAGLATRLADRVTVPLIDPLQVAIQSAETQVARGFVKPMSGSFAATNPIPTIGLERALKRQMES